MKTYVLVRYNVKKWNFFTSKLHSSSYAKKRGVDKVNVKKWNFSYLKHGYNCMQKAGGVAHGKRKPK